MTIPFNQSPLWAILPGQVNVFQLYERQLEFYSAPPEGIAKTWNPENKDDKFSLAIDDGVMDRIPETFTVNNGVGVLPIEGTIIPKSDFFSLFFGGFAALDLLTRDFNKMMGESDIHTIVLNVDSPGGSAFGVQQFANIIFEARSKKKIIAVTSGMMASAAMWISAASHEIYITGDVTVVGSIGTVTTHIDISEMDKKIGVARTEVAAGEFKRVPSMFQPLDEKGRAVLQNQVDHANNAFINDIAKFRGVTPRVVNKKMADGKTFIGTQAIDMGLIDGMISMDTIMKTTGDGKSLDGFVMKKNNNFNNSLMGGKSMSIEAQVLAMKEENPALYQAIYKAGQDEKVSAHNKELPDIKSGERMAGFEAGKAEGLTEGAEAEQKRIADIRTLANPGNLEMIEKFLADGKTTAPDAAMQILQSQKTGKSEDLKKLVTGSPAALDTDGSGSGEVIDTETTKVKVMSEHVADYMAEHKCSKGTAISACAKSFPDAVNDYVVQVKKSA